MKSIQEIKRSAQAFEGKGFASAAAWSDGDNGDSAQTYVRLQMPSQAASLWVNGKQIAEQDASDIEMLFHGSVERGELIAAFKSMAKYLESA